MADDNEAKKPKATLIKHKKSPVKPVVESASGSSSEQKKVVVIKKKVLVRKAPKQEPSKEAAPSEELTTKTAVSAVKKPVKSEPEESGPARPAWKKPVHSVGAGKDTVASPPNVKGGVRRGVQEIETTRTGGRAGVVGGRRVGSSEQRPSGFRSGPGRPSGAGKFRSPGGRPDFSNRSGGGNKRPPSSGGPSRRPSSDGNRGANSTSVLPPSPGRSSKKFYKSKKTYEKSKENQEKLYQYSRKKTVAPANPVPKEIDIMEVITVSELARKMNLKASDLISKLMGMGMMVTINQQIDAETATILADDHNCKVNIVSLYDETIVETEEDSEDDLTLRPPVVTVMGHVDHGKTKLLDAIRDADVVAGEHGGITQHIGAYLVHAPGGNIAFIDTPGHSAFTMMRSRGAQVTDIVILVVAADDGVMPQTVEAIEHAKAAESPIVVVINKMDLEESNPDRVKQQISEYGLMPEDWGGSTQFVEVSALKKQGIDHLLEIILLIAAELDLKANWNRAAEGRVLESKVDQGRGILSTVLVQKGTLKIGDAFIAGIFHGKVRAMFDNKGNLVKEAAPSTPVEVLGFSGIPDAGDPLQVTSNEKEARQIGLKRQELRKMETVSNVKKVTLDNLYDSIEQGSLQELKVLIKGDVHGSVEALKSALEALSTSEIRLLCLRAAAGAIIEDDVNLAVSSNAIIIGFHVRPTAKAQAIIDREKIDLRKYNIIYDAVEDIKSAMEGMLSPEYEEQTTGQLEVRETFQVPKIGTIAGCMVVSGYITRKSRIHVTRENIVVHTGNLESLKRFKDDAKEVKEGFECGVGLENYADIKVGDVLEVFEMKEVAKKLGKPVKN